MDNSAVGEGDGKANGFGTGDLRCCLLPLLLGNGGRWFLQLFLVIWSGDGSYPAPSFHALYCVTREAHHQRTIRIIIDVDA